MPGERMEELAVISGVGRSMSGRRVGIPELDLTLDACLAAIADAGLSPSDIDGLVTWPGEDSSGSGLLERRILLEEVRIRLLAIANSLPDLRIDATELRNDAEELAAVARRVRWIAEEATLDLRNSLNPLSQPSNLWLGSGASSIRRQDLPRATRDDHLYGPQAS
jgi:hypothetical protein